VGAAGEAGKALKVRGIIQGGACLTVRKHGMDRYQNRALAWAQPEWVDQVRDVIRWLRCSVRTEQGYVDEVLHAGSLLYGFGLRLMEGTRLRVDDGECDRHHPQRRRLRHQASL
jgi:hypothetical protein